VLIRATKDAHFYDYPNQRVKADYVSPGGTERMKDYSTFLLGICTENECRLKLNRHGKLYNYFVSMWQQGESVKIPVFEEDYTLNEAAACFYLPINEVHDKAITYQMENTSAFTGICFVKHTPANWNFWHFSVRWRNQDGIDISETEGRWRSLLSAARNLLMEVGLPERPQCKELSSRHYVIP